MVQKRLKIIISLLAVFILSAYTYPDGTSYLSISCNQGNLIIYFPSNVENKIIYDSVNEELINVSGSTVYGYTSISGNDYRITFPTFDIPYYSINYNDTRYIREVKIQENYRVKLYTEFSSDMTTYIGVIIVFLLFFMLFRR